MKKNKSKKFSVLLMGPGRGHNIIYALELLNDCDSITTTFVTNKYSFGPDRFPNIKILDLYHQNKIILWYRRLKKLVFISKQNVIYIQGRIIQYDLFILTLFKRYEKIVFNLWGEYVIGKLEEKSREGKMYRQLFSKEDLIQCNWFGTYNKLIGVDGNLKRKATVEVWGLSDAYFVNKPIISKFMKDFISKIEQHRFVLLNTRSIAEYNAIEELLESILHLRELDKDIYEDVLLIFWAGNNVDVSKKIIIQEFISLNKLEQHIWYVEHPFLPDSDIKQLIEHANVVVNLVKHDQLSTSIIEALCLGKDLICSDIEPYRILNDMYDLELNLIDIDSLKVAHEIIGLAKERQETKQKMEMINKRKQVVESNFRKKNNSKKIIQMLKSVAN